MNTASTDPDPRRGTMKDRRALMLANAGLIAGLALGSIAIAGASPTPAWAAESGIARRTTEPSASRIAVAETPAERRLARRGLVGLVAAITGMDVRDVEWQRRAGQSLAAIARVKGVAAERVVGAAMAELATVLDGDVASGRITARQRGAVLESAREGIVARIMASSVSPDLAT